MSAPPHPEHRRTAIVTGAAGGIRAVVAQRVATGGLAVAVLDLDEGAQCVVDTVTRAGGTALAVGAEIFDGTSVEKAVDKITTEHGAPVILVDNAPEDIAHAISFLASEGAGFVSGQVLYVAGGPKV